MSILDRIFGSDDGDRAGKLDSWLEETLKREMKLDKVERDDDGDIPLEHGSTVVYLRAIEAEDAASCIMIFAPLIEDFVMRPEVYEAVNTINLNTPFAKAVVSPDGPQIILSAELHIFDDLSIDQLMATLDLVSDRADHYDTLLQKRFGGRTMLEDAEDDEFDV